MILALYLLAAGSAACVEVEGERILARDLAARYPAFAALAPETSLGYAPAPGSRRLLSPRELASAGMPPDSAESVCVERVAERLTLGRLTAVLRSSLADHPEARIEIVDFSRYPVPKGELEFPISGLAAPQPSGALWRGRVRYGRRSAPVWARVKISVRAARVVARETLAARKPIEAGQVQVETADIFPLSGQAPASLEQVVGRVPKRSVPAGSPVLAAMLEDARQVERGETVWVEVSSGAAQLRFQARAEAGGNSGDVIPVRNPENGRRFPARVEDKHKVRIDANFQNDPTAPVVAAGSGRR